MNSDYGYVGLKIVLEVRRGQGKRKKYFYLSSFLVLTTEGIRE